MQFCRSCVAWGFLASPYGPRSAGRGVAIGTSSTASDESVTIPSNSQLLSPRMAIDGGKTHGIELCGYLPSIPSFREIAGTVASIALASRYPAPSCLVRCATRE